MLRWMAAAPDREPHKLFRVLAIHTELAAAMDGIGALILGHPLVDPREREIVIQRTTARCGAEYEWGVHAVIFGAPLGLSERQLVATVRGDAGDAAWFERDAPLVRLSDELHDDANIADELWRELEQHWARPQLLELIVTAGWYRLISQLLRSTRVELESRAGRFPAAIPIDGSGA